MLHGNRCTEHFCSGGDGACIVLIFVSWLQRTRSWEPKECLHGHRIRPSAWHSNGGQLLGRRSADVAVCAAAWCCLASAFAGAATRCAGVLGCAAATQASPQSGAARLVLPYAVHVLQHGCEAQYHTPPERAADGRAFVCQPRARVRSVLRCVCVPVVNSVKKCYAAEGPTL